MKSLVEAVRDHREAETRALDLERIRLGLMRDADAPAGRKPGSRHADRGEIRRLLGLGQTVEQVAEAAHASKRTVLEESKSLRRTELGLVPILAPRRRHALDDAAEAWALARYAEGVSAREIALELHVSRDTIASLMKRRRAVRNPRNAPDVGARVYVERLRDTLRREGRL